jgi:hypothetical protein
VALKFANRTNYRRLDGGGMLRFSESGYAYNIGDKEIFFHLSGLNDDLEKCIEANSIKYEFQFNWIGTIEML